MDYLEILKNEKSIFNLIKNINNLSINDLGIAFNYCKNIRDDLINKNKLKTAKQIQEKINALFLDGRLDRLFEENEFGYSKNGNINQVHIDREIIYPNILKS